MECRGAGFRIAWPLAYHFLRSRGDLCEPCADAILRAIVFRNGSGSRPLKTWNAFCDGALSATCMAVFGLVQYFTGNGKFLWFYTHPFSNTFDRSKEALLIEIILPIFLPWESVR